MRHPSLASLLFAVSGACGPSGAPLAATDAGATVDAPAPASTGSTAPADPSTGAAATGDPATTGDPTTSGAPPASSTTGDATTGAPVEPWAPRPCPDIYAQDLLPTFELDIAADELAALEAEWLAADDGHTPEHPLLQFRYGPTVITDASVRLRGNPDWWPAQGKMQLEVSFNTYDDGGRFQGLKHLAFDANKLNRSYLRDRLAMQILRDVGLPAPCANNARLVLNGEYYGLFTSVEKVDREFLERTFEDPTGNLYKRFHWNKKTNEDDPDTSDIDALQAVTTLDELLALMNLDEAVLEWATEAVLPDNDGPWAGGVNWYAYNDPKTGFNVIPWDMDNTFSHLPADTDPLLYAKENSWGRPFYDLALADPVWFDRYLDALALALERGYAVPALQARIDAWSAQIAAAAEADPGRPFGFDEHLDAVQELRAYVAARAEFLAGWLACWQGGGTKGDDGTCKPP